MSVTHGPELIVTLNICPQTLLKADNPQKSGTSALQACTQRTAEHLQREKEEAIAAHIWSCGAVCCLDHVLAVQGVGIL